MSSLPSARLNRTLALAGALETVASELARELRQRMKAAPKSRGATLRPGVETPLWNALVESSKPHLQKRGAKSLLAAELALDRSRVSEFFVTRRAMPDAERTLELLVWLARKQADARK